VKISDIYVTPGSQAGSAKLKHQVHKATVAAGKKPRLELGTVGLSIGQAQSTGSTSRITEALEGDAAYDMLVKLSKMIDANVRVPPDDGSVLFSKADAVRDAIQFANDSFASGKTVTSRYQNGLNSLNSYIGHTNLFKQISELQERLHEEGFNITPWIDELMTGLGNGEKYARQLETHMKVVNELYDFLWEIWHTRPGNENFAFCRAALKKLGIQERDHAAD
jgi:hypothetical protein